MQFCVKPRADYLENLFSFSTSNAAGGVDLNLTLRFPDHIALQAEVEEELRSHTWAKAAVSQYSKTQQQVRVRHA